VLIFLTLPINILTLGLFTFVVNGMVLKICAAILPGFQVKSWFAAIIGSIILSVIGTAMHFLLV
jgi:putative membrane protein